MKRRLFLVALIVIATSPIAWCQGDSNPKPLIVSGTGTPVDTTQYQNIKFWFDENSYAVYLKQPGNTFSSLTGTSGALLSSTMGIILTTGSTATPTPGQIIFTGTVFMGYTGTGTTQGWHQLNN